MNESRKKCQSKFLCGEVTTTSGEVIGVCTQVNCLHMPACIPSWTRFGLWAANATATADQGLDLAENFADDFAFADDETDYYDGVTDADIITSGLLL